MSYSDPNQIPNQGSYIPSPNDMNSIESEQKLKLYQAFIFSIPICFTFIVLFVFYVIYLRRRNSSVDWSSLGMRGSLVTTNNNLAMVELGLSKELREMLPIVIFKETFSINDSLCSVCLGDYQADEKLQQIPACGHTFHMDCIDLWLTSHTTCPLCRLCLISKDRSHQRPEPVASMENSNEGGVSAQPESESTTEAVIHIDEVQEGEGDIREVIKETEENDRNSVGTSNNACCNCRPG